MIICPVCEHQQAQGSECDVCGKRFVAANDAQVPVARMPELELTQIANPKLVAPAETVAELERTRLPSVPEVPAVPMPDLDLARAADLNVPVEPLMGMELHREAPPAEPATPAPTGAVTCRYCRNVQAAGLMCDRCGMRLPKYTASAEAAKTSSAEGAIVVHGCGAKTPSGARCTSCGTFVPLQE